MNSVSDSVENFAGLLIFSISQTEYCLSNTSISSVIKPGNINTLKKYGGFNYSLLKIENKTIPLIDLKKIFQNKTQKITANTRVILVEYMDMQFGILVEKVKEMVAMDFDDLKTSPHLNHSKISQFIERTIEFENKELMFLNVESIIKEIGYA